MNHQAIKKIFLGLVLFLITGCASFASDYKYKVLDPRYNSSIEEYTYDEETSRLIEKSDEQKEHPYRKNMLIVLLGVVPLLFLVRTVRVLKKVDEDATPENFNFVREFFAAEKVKSFNKTVVNTAAYIKDSLCVVKPVSKVTVEKFNESIEKIKQQKIKEEQAAKKENNKQIVKQPSVQKQVQTKQNPPVRQKAPQHNPLKNLKNRTAQKVQIMKKTQQKELSVQDIRAYEKGMDSYVQATMKKMKNPMLVTTSKLAANKGFCVVEFNKEFSLIGYIGDEIFILDKFKKLASSEIRTRLSERINHKDRYIVRLGSYKSLVEVTETSMKMLMEL